MATAIIFIPATKKSINSVRTAKKEVAWSQKGWTKMLRGAMMGRMVP